MKAFYTDHFVLPLPPGHRFPMKKYAQLRHEILAQAVLPQDHLCVPDAATDEQLLRCHESEYLGKVITGGLSEREMRRIGFPWSPYMVERSRRSAGATIAACESALIDGVAVNLAGGTHHACSDHGEGYCVWNDSVVAAREMQARGIIEHVLVVDCDVHQGNGTAQITVDDPTIFTFSIHGEKNFPFRKFPSNIDLGLQDGTSDEEYLALLEEGVRRAIFMANADFAIYVSGADPYIGDRLGKLALSKAGLLQRDNMVLDLLREAGLPVAVTMGGGYAENIDDIVEIHLNTVRVTMGFTG